MRFRIEYAQIDLLVWLLCVHDDGGLGAGPDIEPCDLAALWAGGSAGGTLVKNSSRCEQCQASRGNLPYGSVSVRVAALA